MKLSNEELNIIMPLIMKWKKEVAKKGLDTSVLASGYGFMTLLEKIYNLGKENN